MGKPKRGTRIRADVIADVIEGEVREVTSGGMSFQIDGGPLRWFRWAEVRSWSRV
jgi:hypothetical protein